MYKLIAPILLLLSLPINAAYVSVDIFKIEM